MIQELKQQEEKMLKGVEHESAPGMKISFDWEDFQNTNSFRMGISASYSSKYLLLLT